MIVKGSAWVNANIVAEEANDDWDASSSSSEDEAALSAKTPAENAGLTRRELRRQQVIKESEDIFSVGPSHDDPAERERQVRMADLKSGMSLLRIDVSEEEKNRIVEGSMEKRVSGVSAGSVLAGRPFVTTKDIDDIVRIAVRDISSYEKVQAANKKSLYPQLLETLFKELAGSREAPEIRRLASALEDVAAIKLRKVTTVKAKPQIAAGRKTGGGSRFDIDGSLGAGEDIFDD